MNPKKNIFDYNSAIEKLPEEWMSDMAIVFREFDEDEDGKISISTARHIFDIFRLPAKDAFKECEFVTFKRFLDEAGIQRDTIFLNSRKRYLLLPNDCWNW